MNKEQKDQYAFKVTQANRTQLVVIVYDIIIDYIKSSEDAYSKGDLELYDKDLKQAQKFVRELMATLDFNYEISKDLMSIYLYVNKQLITAMIQRKPDSLKGLGDVIDKLRVGYDTISRTDYSKAVMKNTEQVYAGLTYHKTELSESYVDNHDGNRGFRV